MGGHVDAGQRPGRRRRRGDGAGLPGRPRPDRAGCLRHRGLHPGQRAVPPLPDPGSDRDPVRRHQRAGRRDPLLAHLRWAEDHAINDNNLAGAYIAARGPVAAVSKAFGVTFAMYRGPDGHEDRAPSATATVPASLASAVLAVSGLDTASHLMKPKLPPPGPNYWVAPPCSSYYGQKIATAEPTAYGRRQPWTNCGYTPSQIRGAYGVTASGMTGAGQTVAIVDAYSSPTMLADANQYARVTGDQPFAVGQYQQLQASPFTQSAQAACNPPGWYGEETLDVESVHGQAPGANVRY